MPPVADPALSPTPRVADPMRSRPFRVVERRDDTYDTVTLALDPVDGVRLPFEPGQFTMLGRMGVGEVPISISGDPRGGPLVHTIRDVGGVTSVLAQARVGDLLDVRGPYGTAWDVADGESGDVVVVTGGIGLAPLRPAILELVANRSRYGNVAVLYGARSPADRLYPAELEEWDDLGLQVESIVDHGTEQWRGRVGLVTTLVPRAVIEPERTLALVCGPEVMMRFVSNALIDRGVRPERIRLSMERHMKCGVGLCGHCQLRELFVCVDGPVFDHPTLAPLLAIREA